MDLSVLDLLLVLLAAFVGGQVVTRLGYPAVLGELGIGILLGPPLLGWLNGGDALLVLAEVGVLTMMLFIGMEIDLRDLGRASTAGLLAAVGGFVVPFAGGYAVTVAFGYSPMAAVFVGIAVGVTSLVTKSRILVDLGILDTRIAHVMMAGALIADTISLVVFAGVISVASVGTLDVAGLGLILGRIALFFGAAWLLGRYVIPPVFRRVAQRGWVGRTGYLTLVVLTGLGFAEMAELAGLHGILGAFLAGLFLREAIRAKRLSVELTGTVKDLSLGFLAPIFFVTAGFEVSFAVFRDALPLLVITIVVATVGKILGTALFYLPSGHGWREGVTVGLGMNGRGAVEIIIAGIGLQAGIIDTTIFSVLVFMAIFTTATVPIFLAWGVRWLERHGELVRADDSGQLVLVVGAGPIARRLALLLVAARPVRLLDLNPANVALAKAAGLDAVQGDALDADALVRAGVEDAAVLVAATPNPIVNVLVAQRARTAFLVPKVASLLKLDTDGGLFDTLRSYGGAPLLGTPIDADRWRAIAAGDAPIVELDAAAARALVAEADPDLGARGLLPLVLRRGASVRPFDAADPLGDDDVVLALRDPSAPMPQPEEASDA